MFINVQHIHFVMNIHTTVPLEFNKVTQPSLSLVLSVTSNFDVKFNNNKKDVGQITNLKSNLNCRLEKLLERLILDHQLLLDLQILSNSRLQEGPIQILL